MMLSEMMLSDMSVMSEMSEMSDMSEMSEMSDIWRSYSLARRHWCPPPYLDTIHPPGPNTLPSHTNMA